MDYLNCNARTTLEDSSFELPTSDSLNANHNNVNVFLAPGYVDILDISLWIWNIN